MSVKAFYTDGQVPTLSRRHQPGAVECELEYLSEGGANTVYSITTAHGDDTPNGLQGRLLRLRKDLRHVRPASEQLKAYKEHFADLFAEGNLIQHELIQLENGLTTVLNDSIGERVRPSRRLQDRLPLDERFGVLITDMSPRLGDTLVEIKPKWLLQSPNAPGDAKRCRTCALRAPPRGQEHAYGHGRARLLSVGVGEAATRPIGNGPPRASQTTRGWRRSSPSKRKVCSAR